MQFIVDYWLLWTIIAVVCFGFVVRNMLKHVTGSAPISSFKRGMGPMFAVACVGWASLLLLAISTIVNIVKYLKT
jgi:hypothetical protein